LIIYKRIETTKGRNQEWIDNPETLAMLGTHGYMWRMAFYSYV